MDGRTLPIIFILQQLLDLAFRVTESVLTLVKWHHAIEHVPDHSTTSRRFSSMRWSTLLDRFFEHIIAPLPERETAGITDATSYSGRKRACALRSTLSAPWRIGPRRM